MIKHEHDEAFLMGQVASLIAVMSAMASALTPATRKRMLQQLRPQFDSLIAAMRTTGATEMQTERKGAEWVRDMFLSQLANADKPKERKTSTPPGEALDIQL